MIKPCGFDEAIVGIGSVMTDSGEEDVLVYDIDKMIEVLMKREGITHVDATEFLYFNVIGAYAGAVGPCYMRNTGSLSPEEDEWIH